MCKDEQQTRDKGNKPILFSTLYDDFAPVLYGLVLRFTTNVPLANLILQKIFIEVWHNRELMALSGTSRFPYFFKIAFKHCKTELDLPSEAILPTCYPTRSSTSISPQDDQLSH